MWHYIWRQAITKLWETYTPIYLALIPAWRNNHIHYKMWDEITYPFLNFKGATVEV